MQLKKPFLYAKILEKKLKEVTEENKQLKYSFRGLDKTQGETIEELKD